MSKSAIYVVNNSAQTLAVGNTVALGVVNRRFGCAIDLNGNSVTLDDQGYYDVNVSVTAAPTAAGTVTITLFNNGVAVPGATASNATTVGGNPVNVSFESLVRVFCGANAGALTIVLTGSAATVSNVALVVTKI